MDLKKMIMERATGRQICIYGAEQVGEQMLSLMRALGVEVGFFIDRKWQQLDGYFRLPVRSVDAIDCCEHFVALSDSASLRTTDSMKQELQNRGYNYGDWFHWSEDVDFDISLNNIQIGKRTRIIELFLKPHIEKKILSIGRYTSINKNLSIEASLYIGLSSSVRVLNDDVRSLKLWVANRIEIGHDVYIGANVFINQSKVKKIGNGAILGTGAVVLEDVPPYAVVVGVPGKIKKFRFEPNEIAILEKEKWWEWDDEKMKANADCFTNPKLFFERFAEGMHQINTNNEFGEKPVLRRNNADLEDMHEKLEALLQAEQ